jgi:hypothetical protein
MLFAIVAALLAMTLLEAAMTLLRGVYTLVI